MSRMSHETGSGTKTEIPWNETDRDVYIRRVTKEEMARLFPQITAEGDADWYATFSGKDGDPCSLSDGRDTAIGCAIEHQCIIHPIH